MEIQDSPKILIHKPEAILLRNAEAISPLSTQDNQSQPYLYDRDFMLWIETTAQLLKDRKFSELDIENLIEEIEAMGRSDKSALRSNLIVVLMHLLKWKYQPEKRSKSWQLSILEHRRHLNDDFEDSPSLKRYYAEIFNKCYENACKQAAIETGIYLEEFSRGSPFTPEQVLDSEFLP